METKKDFESINAKEWDEESLSPTAPPSPAQPAAVAKGQAVLNSDRQIKPSHPQGLVGVQDGSSQQNPMDYYTSMGTKSAANIDPFNGRVRARYASSHTRTVDASRASFPKPGLPRNSSRRRNERSGNHRAQQKSLSSGSDRTNRANTVWARPDGLVTNRMKSNLEGKAEKVAETQKYLGRPDQDREFPATGYYLWPGKDESAMDLLGLKLEDLDVVRITHKVFIDWDDVARCLRVNSLSNSDSKMDIVAAIKGIRQAVQNANAKAISASPLYIVVPPTANTIRSVVRPKFPTEDPFPSLPKVVGFELFGQSYSENELLIWRSQRDGLMQSNLEMFRDHLRRHTADLAPLRGWMRMRIHFGHLNLIQYRGDFAKSTFSFEQFVQMMKDVRTTGQFDRKISDAKIAMETKKKILERPEIFCPLEPGSGGLIDVKPKHAEIIFVTTAGGQNLRIEADIDVVSGGQMDQYQIGTTRLFHDNQRNKRVQVNTIDIESQFDWTLEIITDNSISDIPKHLHSFIECSLSGKSAERVDTLGLTYPGVGPKVPYDLHVKSVVVRSVTQYLMIETGYIVEISIYRVWNGCNTAPEPVILSSVTIFHHTWETEMESIENNTKERIWDPQLSNFFHNGEADDSGIKRFFDAVQLIQGFLRDAVANATPL